MSKTFDRHLLANKLYFGDNLHILREHQPQWTTPTRPMKEEAIGAGFYQTPSPFQGEGRGGVGTEYPKLQILAIEGLLSGTERARFPDLSLGRATFKQAAVEDMSAEQERMF